MFCIRLPAEFGAWFFLTVVVNSIVDEPVLSPAYVSFFLTWTILNPMRRRDLKTGSEVQICVDVAKAMASSGSRVRVVSMPCWELFEAQDQAYQLEGKLFFHRIGIQYGQTCSFVLMPVCPKTLGSFGHRVAYICRP